MRAEFEKQSRSGPISGAAGNALGGAAGPGNFDLAGWMAGATSSPLAAADAAGRGPAASGRDVAGSARRRG